MAKKMMPLSISSSFNLLMAKLLSASNTSSEKSLIILLDIFGLVSRNPEVIASVNREMVVRFQSDYLASSPRI
jgi:hypothetical protein